MTKNKQRLYLKILVVTFFFVIIGSYSYLKTRDFLSGTSLVVSDPVDGQTVTALVPFKIKGGSNQINKIMVNGDTVLADENGDFSKSYIFAKGYNVIEVRAVDRFNREFVKLLRVTGS